MDHSFFCIVSMHFAVGVLFIIGFLCQLCRTILTIVFELEIINWLLGYQLPATTLKTSTELSLFFMHMKGMYTVCTKSLPVSPQKDPVSVWTQCSCFSSMAMLLGLEKICCQSVCLDTSTSVCQLSSSPTHLACLFLFLFLPQAVSITLPA